jgi:hypothetical protein
LAVEVARFGSDIEVLDPPEVREQLHQIGAELVDLYRQTGS